ncbi:hypothetical protein GCM10029978_080660 [Actinoallomurus acanthiterrae]
MEAELGGDVDEDAAVGDLLLDPAGTERHRQAEHRVRAGGGLGQRRVVGQVSEDRPGALAGLRPTAGATR